MRLMIMRRKTTKKEFNKFKEFFLDWTYTLGLRNYWFTFIHQYLSSSYANIMYGINSRICVVSFATRVDMYFDDKMIERIAFHEACELFLADLAQLVPKKDLEKLECEKHKIIRTLENIFIGE